jgi:hypothetical protein
MRDEIYDELSSHDSFKIVESEMKRRSGIEETTKGACDPSYCALTKDEDGRGRKSKWFQIYLPYPRSETNETNQRHIECFNSRSSQKRISFHPVIRAPFPFPISLHSPINIIQFLDRDMLVHDRRFTESLHHLVAYGVLRREEIINSVRE